MVKYCVQVDSTSEGRNVILSPPAWFHIQWSPCPEVSPVAILAEAFIWQLKVQCQVLVLGLHYHVEPLLWAFRKSLLSTSYLHVFPYSILITVMVGFSLVPIPSWPLQGSIEMVDAALGPVWALFSALPKRYTDTPPGKFSHWLQPAGEVGLFLLPQIRWFHDLINTRCGCSTIPSQPQTPGRPHAWAEHPQRSASSTTSGYPHWHIFMCLCCILLPLMPPFSLSPPSRSSRLPEANPYSSVVTVGQHCSKHFVAIHCIEQAGLRKWYQKCTFTLRSIVYFHLLRGGSLLGWKLSLHSSSAHSSVTKSTTVT